MLNEEISAEIITPDGIFYIGDAHMVTIPGAYGEFGVLAGHVESIMGLKPGIVTIYSKAKEERFFISGGFVEITPTSATLLVEAAGKLSDYQLTESQKKLKDLQQELISCTDEAEKLRIEKDIQNTEALLLFL